MLNLGFGYDAYCHWKIAPALLNCRKFMPIREGVGKSGQTGVPQIYWQEIIMQLDLSTKSRYLAT
jgi:hypothetical protein